jgi:hypothetical protein
MTKGRRKKKENNSSSLQKENTRIRGREVKEKKHEREDLVVVRSKQDSDGRSNDDCGSG